MFFIKKGSAFTNKMHYLCQHSVPRKLRGIVYLFTIIVSSYLVSERFIISDDPNTTAT